MQEENPPFTPSFELKCIPNRYPSFQLTSWNCCAECKKTAYTESYSKMPLTLTISQQYFLLHVISPNFEQKANEKFWNFFGKFQTAVMSRIFSVHSEKITRTSSSTIYSEKWLCNHTSLLNWFRFSSFISTGLLSSSCKISNWWYANQRIQFHSHGKILTTALVSLHCVREPEKHEGNLEARIQRSKDSQHRNWGRQL